MSEVGFLAGYDVVVCGACGAGFADRIPTQAHFDEYYRDLSKYEYDQRDGMESEHDRLRLQQVVADLLPHLPGTNARVLDVGCASGRLLSLLRAEGVDSVTGLDPSPRCCDVARRLYGIDVRTGTLNRLPSSMQQYDVVLLIGVLEHLEDLDVALAAVRRLLAPAGIVWVEVPDVLGFSEWPNAPFQEFSVEHIQFFSPRSLSNLMSLRGFEEVTVLRNSRPQSSGTIMPNLSAMFRMLPALDGDAPEITRDSETLPALREYVAWSAAQDGRLQQRIDDVVDSARPIAVWGVGTHTSRLLSSSRLRDARIIAFVDSNLKYHGHTLNGIPVVGPEWLRGRGEAILISSRVFEREIRDQIRDELRLPNDIILLYEV
ncbi:class I SAM-dependent methyltransferase [Roseisolibacter agri]|uniref:class I SAM-dependent methyltransferase n=1 Tax=Roseisolibacter agri TaxID=2014610 RepID=UPI0024E17A55|nr:class I SAM-dependent methyltransferase [Roseisolibacter agri]